MAEGSVTNPQRGPSLIIARWGPYRLDASKDACPKWDPERSHQSPTRSVGSFMDCRLPVNEIVLELCMAQRDLVRIVKMVLHDDLGG